MKKTDGLDNWRSNAIKIARAAQRSSTLYPTIMGATRAIAGSDYYTAAQKVARIRILLDAVDQVRAEDHATSITQQGGADHDRVCHVDLSNQP